MLAMKTTNSSKYTVRTWKYSTLMRSPMAGMSAEEVTIHCCVAAPSTD